MGHPVVLPALIPDIKRVYDVYFASFQNEGMARLMLSVMFPGNTVDEPGFREAHTKGTLGWWHQSDLQYTFKAVDNESGETIGMALADILMRERTEEERKFGGIPWLAGKERERAEAVVGPLAEMREKLFGGHKHVYCHVMAVVPEYQGRNAGRALLEFAILTANQLCLPLYFESSPTTVGLYKKMGFEELPERIVHKAEVLGTETDIEVPLMVKMPASAGDMTFAQWIASGYPSLVVPSPKSVGGEARGVPRVEKRDICATAPASVAKSATALV